jgi:hypothetical protein
MRDWTSEDDALLRELWRRGVRYLSGARDAPDDGREMPLPELVSRLSVHSHPRLRHALIALFLLHPEYAESIPSLVADGNPEQRDTLRVLYMAAVYLQRLWRTRLTRCLGKQPDLPDLFSHQLSLPPAEERHGKTGLYALADLHARQARFPFNYLASYQKVADNLFGQLKAERGVV